MPVNPFRTAVPFWGKPLNFQVACLQNGTAVLKGLVKSVLVGTHACCLLRDIEEVLWIGSVQAIIRSTVPIGSRRGKQLGHGPIRRITVYSPHQIEQDYNIYTPSTCK